MAKISKEQGQKIFLGALMLIVIVAGGWMGLIKPIFTSIRANNLKLEKLESDAQAARAQLAVSSKVHAKAAELESIYDSVLKDIPAGAPITWFPPRVTKFFNSMGISTITIIRGGVNVPTQEGLKDFEELGWTMQIGNTTFMKFGTALAAFETSQPLVQITSVSISAGAPDAEFQTFEVAFNLLLPKQPDSSAP